MQGSTGALTERRNQLFYGDNLDVLREYIASESVDLIYLDPPFNSAANYNMLFREPEGFQSQAQIEAFEDTWQWGMEAEQAFDDVLRSDNQHLGKLIHALRDALGDNSMMAYLAMMAVRLIELRRVLKPSGSLYLHCDPTASHYLKLILDGVFGVENYRNEIVWKRTSAHGNVSAGYGDVTDTIFYFSKGSHPKWNKPMMALSDKHIAEKYNTVDERGRRYTTRDMRNPGVRPNLHYEYTALNGKTYKPHPNGWTCTKEKMRQYDEAGLLYYPKSEDGRLRLKLYLDERSGRPMQSLWDDIPPLNSQAQERLGYPTQKPLALMERIISASSDPGDVVLDPFCGCGTTIHAAERLARRWVGIDITHLAISLIESRMVSAFPNVQYELLGTPKDVAGAKMLAERNKHQFEWWALSLVKAQPANDKKKGADRGIDGLLWVRTSQRERAKVVVSVKGGYNINVQMIRDLWGVIEREKAPIGLFVTMHEPTRPMIVEAAKAGFYEWEGNRYPRIQILTIEELLAGVRPELPLIDHAASVKPAQVDRAREVQPALI